MASSLNALQDIGQSKGAEKSWLVTLRRWLVQCPQCTEVRLVVGACENDRYKCKQCGHDFTIGRNRPA
jgi:transposase-like protein